MSIKVAKNGESIHKLDDWHRLAPPKSANQWKDGRSAKECAKAWCGDGVCVPSEIVSLLDSHPITAGATFLTATPEYQVKFDDVRGEPRNADVAAVAMIMDRKIAISIEAKADEPFGSYAGDVAADAIDKLSHKMPTGALTRLMGLVAAILPQRVERQPRLSDIRYQLLTATAGAVAYAREVGAQHAVLIVHEFVTDETSDELHTVNQRDLDRFVRRLSGARDEKLDKGRLAGPYKIPGAPLFEQPADLLIGKVARDIRSRTAK